MTQKTNRLLLIFSCTMIIFSFIIDSSQSLLLGMKNIILSSSILITDYIAIGGIGAAILNASLLSLFASILIDRSEADMSGIGIGAVFLMFSFGLFGKNVVNILPIMLGGYLFSRVKRIPFGNVIHTVLLSTSFAPIVTEIALMTGLPHVISIPLAIITGTLVGFLIVPVADHLLSIHKGFNLYNVGFAIGILGTIFVSIMKSYGHSPKPRVLVSSGNNLFFTVFLVILFLTMLLVGIFSDKEALHKYRQLIHETGYNDNDFYAKYGIYTVLINMAVNGFLSLFYVLVVAKGDLTGPSIGGILTVVGFSGKGKHFRNIIPIYIGVVLGGMTKSWTIDQPSLLFAALFGTALAPIAGYYGFFWGIVASFINSSVALNSGQLHAGLNLYNTGFSVGIVAAVLIPLLESFNVKHK
ncbi:MAG: DUF1576 domain-containing protein [Erysipelothrix sp.]